MILLLILMLVAPLISEAQQVCPNPETNPLNSGSNTTINNTSPIAIWSATGTACSGIIVNVGDETINCRSLSEGVPSATTGQTILPKAVLILTASARHEWQCIALEGTSEVSATREKQ